MEYEVPMSVDEICVSKHFCALYKNIPDRIAEMSEEELIEKANPTRIDWQLRMRFWQLMYRVQNHESDYSKIYNTHIYDAICSQNVFYKKISTPHKFAFIVRPVEKFTDELDTMLMVTRAKLWELITRLKVYNKEKDRIDKGNAEMLLKIHDRLVDRKMGAVRQKIEMKKIQLNMSTQLPSDRDIDSSIEELEGKVDFGDKQLSDQ